MKQIYTLTVLLPAIVSCYTIHQPSAVGTAIFEKTGDMELQGTIRKHFPNPHGGTFNLGYSVALTDKHAAILNVEYQNVPFEQNPFVDSYSFTNHFAELYLGRYFDKANSNISIFLGFGRGYQDKQYEVYHHSYDARYISDYTVTSALFTQSFKVSAFKQRQKYFFTYFCRINYIHNYNIEVHLEHHYYYKELLSHKNMLSVEPGMTLRRNFGKVGLFLQGIFAFNPEDIYNKFTGNDEFMTTRPIFLMGISYNLNHKKH